MIFPLLILIAGQTAAPAAEPKPTFAQILEGANRAWYGLPAADTSFVGSEKSGEGEAVRRASFREVREGKGAFFEIIVGDSRAAIHTDGVTGMILDYARREYAVAPVPARPTWEEREPEVKAGDPKQSGIFFNSKVGLVVATPGRIMAIVSDTSQGGARTIVARLVPIPGDEAAGKLEFRGVMDVRKGFFRTVDITAVFRDEPDKRNIAVYRCDDRVRGGFRFMPDASETEGWTRKEAGAGR